MTFFTFPRDSSRAPPLTITPRCAVAASPAAYVTGVLIVSAQGQAMTMMINPFNVQYRPASLPQNHGIVHMSPAMTTTAGVYLLANESTIFSVGERFAWASSTNRMSRDTAESSTVEVVRTTNWDRPMLIDPPDTGWSGRLSTGRASPVRDDSSTVLVPSTTTPSAGILSPVRTDTLDPTGTVDAGTTTTRPVAGSMTLA
mmetsp:Transcript_20683/g.60127  ORF Transcript_20683/g.60127 Transcript_20683/m.60127 type:complete len:200 (+) Transcript_20683:529-1128(+)